jgi:hypothetical protein
MKTCKGCNKELPLESFGKMPHAPDGLRYKCNKCLCEDAKNRVLKNRDKILSRRRELSKLNYLRPDIRIKTIWLLMNSRCNNPKDKRYNRYGGRGICIKWKDFNSFKDDMLDGMKDGNRMLSIERVDNNGNYEKSNCRWATPVEQSNNTVRNVFYDFEGEKFTLAQIARKYGVNYKTLWKRVNKYNLSIEEALQRGAVYALAD